MNKNETLINETEYMNALYDGISEALHSLVDIQNQMQYINSEKLQKEKELCYNKLDEAIRALSFIKLD